MPEKGFSSGHSILSKLFRWPLLFPGYSTQMIPELEEIPMTTSTHRSTDMRWLLVLIVGAGTLFLILVGIGLYLWFDSFLPLVIMIALAVMLLLVSVFMYLMRRHPRDSSALTVSKRYAISWWDRSQDEEWKKKQFENALLAVVGVLILVGVVQYKILPRLRAPDSSPTEIVFLSVGTLSVILLVVWITLLFRRLVVMSSSIYTEQRAKWQWAPIVITLLSIPLGIWLFYGGYLPHDWLTHAGRSRTSPAPLIVLGVLSFLGAIVINRERRVEIASSIIIFTALAFWLVGLSDLMGLNAILVVSAVPAFVLLVLFVYVGIRIFEPIIEYLSRSFRALINFLATLTSLLPKLGRKAWRLIISSKFWKRVDAWIDLQGSRLRILGVYTQEWTDTLLKWANDAITWEEAQGKWSAIRLEYITRLHEVEEEYNKATD